MSQKTQIPGATDSVAVAGAPVGFSIIWRSKRLQSSRPYGYTNPKKKKKKFKPYTNKVKSIFPQ